MRVAILGIALIVCGLIIGTQAGSSPPAAEASFHEIRIYGVMGGANGDATIQFIELRMAAPGQDLVTNREICIYDEDGAPWALFRFPSNVPNDGDEDSILIGTSSFDANWPFTPDFIFGPSNTTAIGAGASATAPIPLDGLIRYGEANAAGCGSPFSTLVDSLAYGSNYTGPVDLTTPNSFSLTTQGEDELAFEGVLCHPASGPCTRNNANDYGLSAPAEARNNNGDEARLGSGTVTPSSSPPPRSQTPPPTDAPTATPTDAPTATPVSSATPTATSLFGVQGDADCDTDVDEGDAVEILEEGAGFGDTECRSASNVNCDAEIDVFDALAIFKHLIDIDEVIDECRAIGDPLDH